jgi:hypothetical protein
LDCDQKGEKTLMEVVRECTGRLVPVVRDSNEAGWIVTRKAKKR